MQSPKLSFLGWCKNGTNLYGTSNYPHSCITIQGQLPITMYRVCTKAIFLSQGSFRDVESKNIILWLVQKGYKLLLGFKSPAFIYRHIGPTMQVSETSELPIAMIPCLHRANFISKGSFRDAESKNIILELVQKGFKLLLGFKLPSFIYRHIGPTMQTSKISGLPIGMVPCLHQNNIYIKRKL